MVNFVARQKTETTMGNVPMMKGNYRKDCRSREKPVGRIDAYNGLVCRFSLGANFEEKMTT